MIDLEAIKARCAAAKKAVAFADGLRVCERRAINAALKDIEDMLRHGAKRDYVFPAWKIDKERGKENEHED